MIYNPETMQLEGEVEKSEKCADSIMNKIIWGKEVPQSEKHGNYK